MNPPPIRVFMVHDHRLFVDAVTILLQHEEDIALVGSATPLDIRTCAMLPVPCDVVLVEASMEDMDAVQVTMNIKSILPEIKVIVLGIKSEETIILRFVEAGASGYLLQEASFPDLLHTIHAVYRGQTICSPRIAALVFARIAELSRQHDRRQQSSLGRLTPREHEILQLLAQGCQNREIAEELGIALHTVKNHIHHLLDKLNVSGRREAIERAYAYDMITGVRLYRYAPLRALGAPSLA